MSKASSDKIKKILEGMKTGDTAGKALRFNPQTKKLEVVSENTADPDEFLKIRAEDAQVFSRTLE